MSLLGRSTAAAANGFPAITFAKPRGVRMSAWFLARPKRSRMSCVIKAFTVGAPLSVLNTTLPLAI